MEQLNNLPQDNAEGFNNKGIEEGFYSDNKDLLYYYPRDNLDKSQVEAYFASPIILRSITYRRCQASFPSKNLMHKYLRNDYYATARGSSKEAR